MNPSGTILTVTTREDLKTVRGRLNSTVARHESMKASYFFKPPEIASMRRQYEERNSSYYEFVYDGKKIVLECDTQCSCRNVYYKGRFRIGGRSVTVRSVKKLLKEVEDKIVP